MWGCLWSLFWGAMRPFNEGSHRSGRCRRHEPFKLLFCLSGQEGSPWGTDLSVKTPCWSCLERVLPESLVGRENAREHDAIGRISYQHANQVVLIFNTSALQSSDQIGQEALYCQFRFPWIGLLLTAGNYCMQLTLIQGVPLNLSHLCWSVSLEPMTQLTCKLVHRYP